jgi:putative membrane protein
MTEPKRPLLIDWEGEADPATAAPITDVPQGRAMQQLAMAAAARRRSGLSRLALWTFSTLATFVLSVAAWDFVTALLQRDSLLGWIAFALVGAAILVTLLLAAREALAFFRLSRLSHLRQAVEQAHDLPKARAAADAITALYAHRPDLDWPRARLTERRPEIFDHDALLSLTETELMAPLDQAARREIEAAARQVAIVTALVPLAFADVAAALWANLRMIRRLAEIYGGRSGSLGSLGLLRRVFAHLIATGAVAIGDDMIGSFAGGGILSRLSRRFGEGVINGALTARVGVAAMELCRPMPFATLPKPKVTNLVSRALTGLWNREGAVDGDGNS